MATPEEVSAFSISPEDRERTLNSVHAAYDIALGEYRRTNQDQLLPDPETSASQRGILKVTFSWVRGDGIRRNVEAGMKDPGILAISSSSLDEISVIFKTHP